MNQEEIRSTWSLFDPHNPPDALAVNETPKKFTENVYISSIPVPIKNIPDLETKRTLSIEAAKMKIIRPFVEGVWDIASVNQQLGSDYRFMYIDEFIGTSDSEKLLTKALTLSKKEGITSAAVIGGKIQEASGPTKDTDPSSGNTIDQILAISDSYDFSFDPKKAYTSIATLDSEENLAGIAQEEKWTYDTYVWLGGNDNNLTYYNKVSFEAFEKLTAPAYFVKYNP